MKIARRNSNLQGEKKPESGLSTKRKWKPSKP